MYGVKRLPHKLGPNMSFKTETLDLDHIVYDWKRISWKDAHVAMWYDSTGLLQLYQSKWGKPEK